MSDLAYDRFCLTILSGRMPAVIPILSDEDGDQALGTSGTAPFEMPEMLDENDTVRAICAISACRRVRQWARAQGCTVAP